MTDKDSHILRYDVLTLVGQNGEIRQVTQSVGVEGYQEHVSTRVLNAQEQQIREGLIRLGWTPPDQEGASAITRLRQYLDAAESVIVRLLEVHENRDHETAKAIAKQMIESDR